MIGQKANRTSARRQIAPSRNMIGACFYSNLSIATTLDCAITHLVLHGNILSVLKAHYSKYSLFNCKLLWQFQEDLLARISFIF